MDSSHYTSDNIWRNIDTFFFIHFTTHTHTHKHRSTTELNLTRTSFTSNVWHNFTNNWVTDHPIKYLFLYRPSASLGHSTPGHHERRMTRRSLLRNKNGRFGWLEVVFNILQKRDRNDITECFHHPKERLTTGPGEIHWSPKMPLYLIRSLPRII